MIRIEIEKSYRVFSVSMIQRNTESDCKPRPVYKEGSACCTS